MIDREPLNLFSSASDEAEETQDAADTDSPPSGWKCQWCAALIPLGAAACPACGGNAPAQQLPTDPMTGNHYEMLDYFGKTGLRDGAAGLVLENYTGFMGGAERKERFQEYFQEGLRRQAQQAARPPQASEPDPAEQPRLCRWCNTVNPDDADFCIQCGTRLPPRPIMDAAPSVARCQWCSAEIEPGAATCPSCGGVATGAPDAHIAGLTELTAYEQAAAYAFSQEAPIRRPSYGLPSTIHNVSRLGKALFGKRD
jgi:RNA polymerase subunit RPABC4/transcription elongation factor Spt4